MRSTLYMVEKSSICGICSW